MSLLIKGMEMPKPKFADMATVYDAYILVSPNGHAAIVVDNEDGLDSTEYPLVHVPPHGRCIDADAILQEATKGEEPFDWIDKNELLRLFFDAPTIIEAEEGET